MGAFEREGAQNRGREWASPRLQGYRRAWCPQFPTPPRAGASCRERRPAKATGKQRAALRGRSYPCGDLSRPTYTSTKSSRCAPGATRRGRSTARPQDKTTLGAFLPRAASASGCGPFSGGWRRALVFGRNHGTCPRPASHPS